MKINKLAWLITFLSSVAYGSVAEYQPGCESFAQESVDTVLDDELIDHLLEGSPKLQLLVARLQQPARYGANIPRKMLLVGPPGVGKSTIAKGIAARIERPYTYIRASLLVNEYKNSGPQNLARELVPIMQSGKPHVIIVDELHTLTEGYKKEQNVDPGTSEALWSLLDECAKNPQILFIGTTNDVTTLPDPLKSRFANTVIEIPLPDLQQRIRIIGYYLRNALCKFDDHYLLHLAKETSALSGREIEQLVNDAITFALDRNGLVFVRKSDFKRALRELEKSRSSLGLSGIKQYLKYLKDHQQITFGVLGIALPLIFQIIGMIWSHQLQKKSNADSLTKAEEHFNAQMIQANQNATEQLKHQLQCNKDMAMANHLSTASLGALPTLFAINPYLGLAALPFVLYLNVNMFQHPEVIKDNVEKVNQRVVAKWQQ